MDAMTFVARLRPGRWLPALLVAFALAAIAPGAGASRPPWSEGSYSYLAESVPIARVLTDFGANFGVRVQVRAGVEGTVNGRIAGTTPGDFLNRLGSAYGFVWFYYGGTLYVSKAADMVTRPVSAPGASLAGLRQALLDLGLLDARFGWGELPERGVALVSGPPEYVDLIARALAELPQVPVDQRVAVFRLKHAAVDDRNMFFRDKQIVTPGVATILRNLIVGNTQQVGTQTVLLDMAAPLRTNLAPGTSVDTLAGAPPAPQPSVPAPAPGAGAQGKPAAVQPPLRNEDPSLAQLRRPVIQADPRLNAVIVRDTPDRMPIYENLIALLDQPTALIEIEAMIIDVNTTRLEELGVDWAARVGRVAAGFGRPDVEADRSTIGIARGTNATPTTVVLDGGNYLIARIKLLEGSGDARIQARPSILTSDNLGALIDLSETFYIRTIGERVAQVVPVTTGTLLRVTPRFVVHEGRRLIQLVIDIEDGAIQDRTVQDLPTIRRSTVSTQAAVGESQSLLIGGYNSEVNIQQDDKVPLLGDIPLLGTLFRHKKNDVQRRERLFLITPKVVALPDQVAPAISSVVPGTVTPPAATAPAPVAPAAVPVPEAVVVPPIAVPLPELPR